MGWIRSYTSLCPCIRLNPIVEGRGGRESLVHLMCIALQKFSVLQMSQPFSLLGFLSCIIVQSSWLIFYIKKITKAEEQNYGKLKYLWRHPVYEPKMNTIVSLPIFCTRPSQWDFIVTGCNLLIRFSAGVKVSKYTSVLLPENKRGRSDQMLLVSYLTSKLYKRNLNRIVHISTIRHDK